LTVHLELRAVSEAGVNRGQTPLVIAENALACAPQRVLYGRRLSKRRRSTAGAPSHLA
jgi:hypothetical protein